MFSLFIILSSKIHLKCQKKVNIIQIFSLEKCALFNGSWLISSRDLVFLSDREMFLGWSISERLTHNLDLMLLNDRYFPMIFKLFPEILGTLLFTYNCTFPCRPISRLSSIFPWQLFLFQFHHVFITSKPLPSITVQ